jgi:hypothetical protein
VSPRARRASLEGGALLGRFGGPRGHHGVDRVVRIFCVRLEIGFAFCVFLQVLSRIAPGFLGDPYGCPDTEPLWSLSNSKVSSCR